MPIKYSTKDYSREHMARAIGRALPISTKASIELCNSLRKGSVASAKAELRKVMNLEAPVKFTRFTNGAGHKKSMAAGKYPVKTAKEILRVIETVESNAQFKGLNTSDLIIKHIAAHKASNVWRYGRFRRRRMKRTNIEVVVEEGKPKKGTEKKQDKSKEKKSEPKKEKTTPKASEKAQNPKQEVATKND